MDVGAHLGAHLGAISARSPQVLRVMDRGIASADSVIKYLVLMMLPAFAEMFVTFVIFYRRESYQKLSNSYLIQIGDLPEHQ